jgi:hypothetical protein
MDAISLTSTQLEREGKIFTSSSQFDTKSAQQEMDADGTGGADSVPESGKSVA